jgi:NAD(P)-dependent dehydrogenase (short-subunit alcohol dehydrogenase family)
MTSPGRGTPRFDLGLAGLRAVVTGGAGAIGSAICRLLAEQGAEAWALDLHPPRDAAPGVRSVVADVRNRASLARVHAEIAAAGPIDILVNGHGLQIRSSAMECTDEALAEIFDTNVSGAWRSAQVFGGPMRRRGGSIVNIASINGIVAAKTGAAYGASKAALIHFTRILALELAPDVRVNAVAPTAVPSGMTADLFADPAYVEAKIRSIPIGRICTPQDVADAVAVLCSPRMAYVTGQIWAIDGGISLP